ncbi:MAG: hypothetical protein ACI3V3_02305 [Faecousia sp.]
MRGNELLDKMELMDPAYVEAADVAPKRKKNNWGKWVAMAACLCLITAGVFAAPRFRGEPEPAPGSTVDRTGEQALCPPLPTVTDANLEESRDRGTIIFNEATAAADVARIYIPGYFTEELSGDELTALKPDRIAPGMEFSGLAGFDGEGALLDIRLQVNAPFLDGPVAVYLSYGEPPRCYALSGEPAVSTVNHVEFTVYQWSPGGGECWLEAYGELNGYSVQIAYETAGESLDQAKEAFAVILDCFSCYEAGKPELSAISADSIPPFIDRQLTPAEAQADVNFGAYMPRNLPGGFGEESIHRYKDQNNDYLSGLWTNGYDEIRWKIYSLNEEAQARITGIADIKNYDLSLYPIPRASSVPDELRNIVDNPIFLAEELTLDAVMARAYRLEDAGDGGGWRMEFSVKYGDTVVEVRTKGVEPEWVYQQLLSFREN